MNYKLMFPSNSRLRSSKLKGDSGLDMRKDMTPKAQQRQQNGKISQFMFSNSKTPVAGEKPKISESYSRFETKLHLDKPLSTKNIDTNKLSFGNRYNEDKKRLSNYSSAKTDSPPKSKSTAYVAPRSKSRSPRKMQEEIVREEIMIPLKKFNITQNREIRHSRNTHPQLPKVIQNLPNYQPAKHSTKPNGLVKAYAACTNQGPVRQYNEDRVSIILNIARPEHCTDWKKAAYFGVFDGHGGVECADYLRDYLHTFLVKEKSFPNNIPDALSQAFYRCETNFIQRCKSMANVDKSGSCAIIVFIYGDTCYIANSGDSRAIMSSFNGDRVSQLSLDHKPSDQYQQKRILQAGGKIYQTKLQNADPTQLISYEGQQLPFILGPHRVLPGRLSVTRTFGDIQAKLPEYGGNPRAIIATPEIRSFKLSKDIDFIILGCDGIFDRLSNDEIIECVWQASKDKTKFNNIHEFCGIAVENIMKLAVYKKTMDNITVVMLGLEGLQTALFPEKSTKATDLKLDMDKIQSGNKLESPKGVRSTTHFQNSSSDVRARGSIYDKRPSRQQEKSASRNSVRKPDTTSSHSILDSKSRRKEHSFLRNLSPSAAGYRSFSYYRN